MNNIDWQNILEYKGLYHTYKRDNKCRDILNSIFGGNIKHCFVAEDRNVETSKGHIDFGISRIIFVNSKGHVYRLSCSEWRSIDRVLKQLDIH